MKGQATISVLLSFVMLTVFSIAFAQVEESAKVIDNGGGYSNTSSTSNIASIGQSVISTATSSNVTNQAGFITSIYGATIDVAETNIKVKPEAFEMKQNYPNPFNANTRIEFQVQAETEIEFCVVNILGEMVMKLRENKQAGSYTITFDSGELPSGIYFYSLRTDNFFKKKEMMIMK